MACGATAGLFRTFLSFSTATTNIILSDHVFGVLRPFLENTEQWACWLSSGHTPFQPQHRRNSALSQEFLGASSGSAASFILVFVKQEYRKKFAGNARTYRFHTDILHCQSVVPPGCHRVKMADGLLYYSRMCVQCSIKEGLILHKHDCTDTLLRALTVRMLCEIKTNQFPGKRTGL